MTPEVAKGMLARQLDAHGETIYVRRYSGAPGSRTSTDYAARGRVTEFQPAELIGNITQGSRKVIVLADDLGTAGFSFPLVAGGSDKIVVRGKEMTVTSVDDNTRRINGTLIAIDVVVNG